MCLQFSPILQPPCLNWHPPFVKRHSPQAIGCEVHIALFDQLYLAAGNGLTVPRFQPYWLPGSCTCTHLTPPERALLRTKGFCGALGEATARGVNLYVDMAAAC